MFEKTGEAIATFVAQGDDDLTYERFGAGVLVAMGTGDDDLTYERSGAGVLVATGEGDGRDDFTKKNIGVLERVASGTRGGTVSKRGTGVSPHSASGTHELSVSRFGVGVAPLSGGGSQEGQEVGKGIATFVGSGGDSTTYVETATALSYSSYWDRNKIGPLFAGTAAAAWTVHRTGFTVRGYAASGIDRMTFVEAGSGVSERVASGVPGKLGVGIAVFTGTGSNEVVYAETGTAVLVATLNGTANPDPGTAIMPLVGAGQWKNLYANNNFSAREVIDLPTGYTDIDSGLRTYLLSGATGQATNESGERLGGVTSLAIISNTLWWTLTVPYRCIVRLDTIPLPLGFGSKWRATGYANRGTAVGSLSSYGGADKHFGEVAGRGMDAWNVGTTSWGMFPNLIGTVVPLSVQVDPQTPLCINVGKNTGLLPGNQQLSYYVSVERLVPPSNDDLSSAELLEGASGTSAFDMTGATGDPRWNWTQFNSLLYFPNSFRLSGDVFYRAFATEDKTLRFRINRLPGTTTGLSDIQVFAFEGDDFDTWTPLQVGITSDAYPYATIGPYPGQGTGYVDVKLLANTPYTIAVCQMRSVFIYPPYGMFSTNVTTRVAGQVEWEMIDADPSNDDFANREVLGSGSSGTTLVADTRGSTFEIDEPSSAPTMITHHSVWYSYSPTASGWYDFTLLDYGVGATIFDVFRGTSLLTLQRVETRSAYYPLWLHGGETYAFRIAPDEGATFDHVSMSWSINQLALAPNDDFADRIAISGSSGTSAFDIRGATNELDEPPGYFWDVWTMPSLWWGFTPPSTGGYVLRVPDDENWYFDVAVYTGSTLGGLTPLGKFSATLTEIGFLATAGVEYKVQVSLSPGYYAPVHGFELEWEPHTIKTNSTFAAAEDISSAARPIVWDNLGMPATPEVGAPDMSALLVDTFEEGRPAWFRITPVHTALYTITVEMGVWEAVVGVFQGSTLATLTPVLDQYGDPLVTYLNEGAANLFDAYLQADTTYYLYLVGVQYLPNTTDPYYPFELALWEDSQVPQGRFTIDWTLSLLNDDLADAGGTTSDLNVVLTPTDDGSPYFYDSVYPAGNCIIGSTFNAAAEVGEPAILGYGPTRTVWFRYQPPLGGDYEFWVEGAGSDPVQDALLAVYSVSGSFTFAHLTSLASDDDTDGLMPRLTVALGAFDVHVIQVDARDEGDFVLHVRHRPVEAAPANDDFADAEVFSPGVLVNGTTVGAMVECGEMASVWNSSWGPWGSVWYTFTATETTAAIIEYHGTTGNYDTVTAFTGTSLSNLVVLAEDYDSPPNGVNVQFSVIDGQTYYIRVMTTGDYMTTYQSPFTLEILQQSTTPPDNDDDADATDFTPGSGTAVGTTDGSTVQPGEADPIGGGALTTGGTVWHKYVAPAPGFIDVYTTRATANNQWYQVGVWEGASPSTGKLVTAHDDRIRSNDPVMACHYEVRGGQTYWIQVIRRAYQTWGEYTLHINEYLETKTWSLDADGFTSTMNSPSISGGVMTCSGNQAIADSLDVLPQYGRLDLGSVPKWCREFRLHFEVRVLGGQILYRELWYGDDDWRNDPMTVAASDDHVNWQTCRIGLFRIRDFDGTQILVGSLGDLWRTGQNSVVLEDNTGHAVSMPLSLGTGGAQHDSGWTSIEVVIDYGNPQRYDGSMSLYTQEGDPYSYPSWSAQLYVDGRPASASNNYGTPSLGGQARAIRYVDVGMFRHPSMFGYAGNPPSASDQRYVENNEAWTMQFRRVRATNVVPSDPYDVTFAGDAGVFEFDGFTSDVPWDTVVYNDWRHQYVINPGGYYNPPTFTGPPQGTKPVLDTVNGYATVRSSFPSGYAAQLRYGMQWSSRRWYGMRFGYAQAAAVTLTIARYELSGIALAKLTLTPTGQLRIAPYGSRDFCVAQLQPDTSYWIEVHVDAEVLWDVKCSVYIEGAFFGTFSNASSSADVLAHVLPSLSLPGPSTDSTLLVYGPAAAFYGVNHDVYFTHLVSGRGNPATSVGPLKTEVVNAIEATSRHHLPDEPGDYIDLNDANNDPQVRVYEWMYEASASGPSVFTDEGGGLNAPLGPVVPRFWEPYFVLLPTTPILITNTGSGNTWTKAAGVWSASGSTRTLEFTQAGQSVPVDDVVTGVEVRVYRTSSGSVSDDSVKLLKAGTPVGTDQAAGAWGVDEVVTYGGPGDLWGTTWSPQEVNALTFGVALSNTGSGTGSIERVTVKVYFDDEGGPADIARGSILAPAGLYNVYGDWGVGEFYATGTGGDPVFSWGYEPTSWGGGPAGPLSGTPIQRWGVLRPLWLWQARGDYEAHVGFISPGDTVTVTDTRVVRNPLAYPRYAWSDDNGATWTWIHLGETASSAHIGTDVGASSGGKALFLDNAGALDVYLHQGGGWSSGLYEDRPTSAHSYRYAYWHTAYTGGATAEAEVIAANFWARWRPYSTTPRTTDGDTSAFHAAIADDDGNARRIGRFYGNALDYYTDSTRGTSTNPHVQRITQARPPDGEAWTTEKFNALTLHVGMYNELTGGTGFITNYDGRGAALYAANWELLVPATPGIQPTPCQQLIDLSMVRYALGAGDPETVGGTTGIDVSDVRYTSGSGDEAGGTTGVDMSDVFYASGAGEE